MNCSRLAPPSIASLSQRGRGPIPDQLLPDPSRYCSFALRFGATSDLADGDFVAAAEPMENSSSFLPDASASRNQCGRGPLPPHSLPLPSLYWEIFEEAFDLPFFCATLGAPLPASPSCSAVNP